MPRAHRYILPGYLYHVTHRCHDRSFLLKFARDRNYYREWLRKAMIRYKVPVLGYCLTRNHIHLVLHSCGEKAISRFMQLVQSRTAQHYNWRKSRKGAFWEDRYHCTMIGSRRYLWDCLLYIDLNMVRAGEVNHPAEWQWCGYREFMGLRERYRILDVHTLLAMLGFSDIEKARASYQTELEKRIRGGELSRNAMWTESVAVGSKAFVETVKRSIPRVRTYTTKGKTPEGMGIWCIREESGAYS